MKFALSAVLCGLLAPMDAMYNASRLGTRTATRSRPLARRTSTVPMQQARPRPIAEAPRQSSMAGLMAGLALLGACYYAWDLKEVILEPSQNVDLDSYTENFMAVEKILAYLEAQPVEPNSEESLGAWKKDCQSAILGSKLPATLKWSLWAQATNSNVWYQKDLRSFFYSAVAKSYLKLDEYQRASLLLSGTEQFADHIYSCLVANLERSLVAHTIESGMAEENFRALLKGVYLRASLETERPSVDKFCQAILATPNTTGDARESLYKAFKEIDRFHSDTLVISQLHDKPFNIADLI